MIKRNRISDTDAGVYLFFGSGSCAVSDDEISNSGALGYELLDGSFTASDGSIRGGGGVAVPRRRR